MTRKPTGDVFHVYPNGASDGGSAGHEIRRTFPVGWVDSYVLGLDKEFVIADFWDRLFLHSNSFGLASNLASEITTEARKARTSWITTAFIVAGN